MVKYLNDKLSLQVPRIQLNMQLMGGRLKVPLRNISFIFKIVSSHELWKMKDSSLLFRFCDTGGKQKLHT